MFISIEDPPTDKFDFVQVGDKWYRCENCCIQWQNEQNLALNVCIVCMYVCMYVCTYVLLVMHTLPHPPPPFFIFFLLEPWICW